MGADDKDKNEAEIITAVYKIHLHCQDCARTIKKHIISIEGVHKVDANVEGAKLTVKGAVDPAKILTVLEKKSHRKVELLSPLPKKQEDKKADGAVVKKDNTEKKKEPEVKKTVIKVYMHCKDCEGELKKRLQALEGVYSVKTDMNASTCTVEGIIEAEKLSKFIQRKLHRKAEIVPPKEKKKEEEIKKVVEIKMEEKKEEKKEEKVVTYVMYCPQGYQCYSLGSDIFSDENVNACSVM